MSAISKIGIAIPSPQNLSKSGENKDLGIKDKTMCNAKMLHTTEERGDEVRKWKHVPS